METITKSKISVKRVDPCDYYIEGCSHCRLTDEPASCEGYIAWCECDKARRRGERDAMEDWKAEAAQEERGR